MRSLRDGRMLGRVDGRDRLGAAAWAVVVFIASIDLGCDTRGYFGSPTVAGWRITVGIHGQPAQVRSETVAHCLELVGLTDHARSHPTQLSGGQALRVALACALAPSPRVIFLDEPFGSLDTYTRNKMQFWLMEIQHQRPKTKLFVPHIVEDAIFLSDRVLLLAGCGILGEYRIPFKRPRDSSIRFDSRFVDLTTSPDKTPGSP